MPRLLLSFIVTGIIFFVWDFYFIQQGVWGFNERFLMGYHIANLPIEEILLFFSFSYTCIFIYEFIKIYSKKQFFIASRLLTLLFMLTCWTVAYEYKQLSYTSVLFSLLGTLYFLNLISDRKFLMNFYFSFLIALIPIVLAYLLLTGTGLPEAIIWYKSYEYSGIKILSLPFENIFYVMALMLMNITIMESFEPEGE